jgi:hypothetical protein
MGRSSFPVPSPVSDRGERANDGCPGDSSENQAITEADTRLVPVRLGFDALDIREQDLLVLKGYLGAVRRIASGDLLQMDAEDVGSQSGGHLAVCEFGFRVVHDRNRTAWRLR